MKIKFWLVISYLLVMILPLLAGWGLYALVIHYHERLEVRDYFEKLQQLNDIRKVLESPGLYHVNADLSSVEAIQSPQTEIKLYLKEGYLFYTTNPLESTMQYKIDFSALYADLYNFDYTYSSYHYKAPVFEGTNVVGLYEVKIARDEWVQGVANITKIITGIFVIILAFIFFFALRNVNKKIIQPIYRLIENFQSFPVTKAVIEKYSRNDEIGELYKHFRSMQEKLIAAEKEAKKEQEEKEMLIASISHDLKTPLTSIRAFAEAIVAQPKKGAQYAETIVSKADYMQKMLSDLLAYSVLQSPKYELQLEMVEAEEFFDMLMHDYESLMEEKNITLITRCNVSGVIGVDVNQWIRVADNLVANAVKFTPQNGTIRIVATQEPQKEKLFSFTKKVCIKEGTYFIVENSGEGIEQEEIAKILEPLYQVDKARTKSGSGTGLGLTIAKQILEKHGGTLEVASEIGVGTSVVCYLPKKGGEKR